nr:MAG TPA: Protein of unknown function (DUF2680) [Caudoviricetes sp.]
MGNPLMQFLGGGTSPMIPGPIGNMMQMMQQFNQFRSTFQGDPKAQVEQLLKSGKMSEEQYKQLEALAKQFMPYIK